MPLMTKFEPIASSQTKEIAETQNVCRQIFRICQNIWMLSRCDIDWIYPIWFFIDRVLCANEPPWNKRIINSYTKMREKAMRPQNVCLSTKEMAKSMSFEVESLISSRYRYSNYLGSLVTNDSECGTKIQRLIVMVKEAIKEVSNERNISLRNI